MTYHAEQAIEYYNQVICKFWKTISYVKKLMDKSKLLPLCKLVR